MQRLLLLILLLTVVYSWEQCKYVVVAIWSKITKQKITGYQNFQTDTIVSDLVLIASIPLSLAYLILGSQNLPVKLLIILAEFLILGLILKGMEEYSRRRHFTRHYQGADKIVATIFSIAGLFSPTAHFAGSVLHSTNNAGKYLSALIIPIISGLALTIAVRKLGMEEFVSRLDTLIVIAVLAITLNLTIEILERMFRVYRFNLTSLLRVALGVVLIFTITQI